MPFHAQQVSSSLIKARDQNSSIRFFVNVDRLDASLIGTFAFTEIGGHKFVFITINDKYEKLRIEKDQAKDEELSDLKKEAKQLRNETRRIQNRIK